MSEKQKLEMLKVHTITGAIYFLNHINWAGFDKMMSIVDSPEVAAIFSCSLTPVEVTLHKG
jgi:hypothetical protein